jgi:hypothetical protein
VAGNYREHRLRRLTLPAASVPGQALRPALVASWATSATPEAQARLLLLIFQGSALVSRAQPDRERLAAGIDAALDALRPAPGEVSSMRRG